MALLCRALALLVYEADKNDPSSTCGLPHLCSKDPTHLASFTALLSEQGCVSKPIASTLSCAFACVASTRAGRCVCHAGRYNEGTGQVPRPRRQPLAASYGHGATGAPCAPPANVGLEESFETARE